MRTKYNFKTLGPRTAQLVVELNEQRKTIFSIDDAIAITGLSRASGRSLLAQAEERGIVTRLKPGLYNLVPFESGRDKEYVSDPYLIAKSLAHDTRYFISHGSAMELHRMVTQPQLAITTSSTKRLRTQHLHGYEFRFLHIKLSDYFGFMNVWVTPEDMIHVSDPERTIIDGLHHPKYVGGISQVALGLWMKRDTIKVPWLIDYATRLDVGAVIRRLGYLLELYDLADPHMLAPLRAKLTATYQRLDPLFPDEGPMQARWRLRLNMEPDELKAVRNS